MRLFAVFCCCVFRCPLLLFFSPSFPYTWYAIHTLFTGGVRITSRSLIAGVRKRDGLAPVAAGRKRGDLQGQHPHQQALQRDTKVNETPAWVQPWLICFCTLF